MRVAHFFNPLIYMVVLVVILVSTTIFNAFAILTSDSVFVYNQLAMQPPAGEINEEQEQILVILKKKRNAVTTDTLDGARTVQLLLIEPMKGLDFRRDTTLRLRVVKLRNLQRDAQTNWVFKADTTLVLDTALYLLFADKPRYSGKTLFLPKEDPSFVYSNFGNLVISIYDRNEKIDFFIQALLSVK